MNGARNSEDQKYRSLKEQKAGKYWSFTQKLHLVITELTGRGISLSFSSIWRTDIGMETFNIKNIGCTVLWMGIWIWASQDPNQEAEAVLGLFTLNTYASMLLSAHAVFFVGFCLVSVFITERKAIDKKVVNVSSRGESVLRPLFAGQKGILGTFWFVQAVVEPGLVFLSGVLFYWVEACRPVGIYCMTGAVIFFIDEAMYHRACARLDRLRYAMKIEGEKTLKKQDEIQDSDSGYYD